MATWSEVLDLLMVATQARLEALERGEIDVRPLGMPAADLGPIPPALVPQAEEVLAFMRSAEDRIAQALAKVRIDLDATTALSAGDGRVPRRPLFDRVL